MYAQDSFHTLSGPGQVGLVVLSVILTSLILWTAWRLMARRNVTTRLVLAVTLFFAFVWLSPQIYYTYYLTLFEGLPWQIVVKRPPDPMTLWHILSFQHGATLSAHSLGLLGWALIVMAPSGRRQDDRA